MSERLSAWNAMETAAAELEILPCAGSTRWARQMAARRPFPDVERLCAQADRVWAQVDQADWEQAFATHPRIGDALAPPAASARSAAWSSQEQDRTSKADHAVREKLQQANIAYEQQFGRTFIICATGRSGEEMLAILVRRLKNDEEQEWREAAEQQKQITQLRLRKWLQA